MRIVYCAFGDRHSGHKYGLAMPGTEIVYHSGEKYELKLSSWSDWLWHEVWLPGVEKVIEFAGDDSLIICDGGDMVHGHRYVDLLYSAEIDHQVQISTMALTPWREAPTLKAILMVTGTGSHDFGNNSAARAVYDKVGAWGYHQKLDEHLYWSQPDGFRLDMAHHGPAVGRRPHLRLGAAQRYGEDRVRRSLERGQRFASVYQRSHYHDPVSVPINLEFGGKYYSSHVFVTPPLCGANGYARQAVSSPELVTSGMFYYEVIDGQVGRICTHLVEKDTRGWYEMPENIFYSNMIKDGGHQKKKKRKKKKK